MAPILGIIASQQPGHISTTSYESIATVTVGVGGSGSISFSSIPSTYKHLQVRGIAQSDRSDFPIDNALLRFNGDTGTNYSQHYMYAGVTANNQMINVGGNASTSSIILANNAGDSMGGQFGSSVIDILDYQNANKYKTIRYLSGNDTNAITNTYSGQVSFGSGNWRSTSAITSLTITPQSGSVWNRYTHFALYGIKG